MREHKEDHVCPGCGTNVANLMQCGDIMHLRLEVPASVPMPHSVRVTRGGRTVTYKPVEEVKDPWWKRLCDVYSAWNCARARRAYDRLAPAYQDAMRLMGCAPRSRES